MKTFAKVFRDCKDEYMRGAYMHAFAELRDRGYTAEEIAKPVDIDPETIQSWMDICKCSRCCKKYECEEAVVKPRVKRD